MNHRTLPETLALIWLQAVAASAGALAESVDQRRRARLKAARPVREPRPQTPPLQPPAWLR